MVGKRVLNEMICKRANTKNRRYSLLDLPFHEQRTYLEKTEVNSTTIYPQIMSY